VKAKILVIIGFLIVFLAFSSGCTVRETQDVWDYFLPEKEPQDSNVPDAYYEIELGQSSSSDVLMLLPQSSFEVSSCLVTAKALLHPGELIREPIECGLR